MSRARLYSTTPPREAPKPSIATMGGKLRRNQSCAPTMVATESDAQQRYLSMVSRSQVGQRTPSGSTEFDTEGLKPWLQHPPNIL